MEWGLVAMPAARCLHGRAGIDSIQSGLTVAPSVGVSRSAKLAPNGVKSNLRPAIEALGHSVPPAARTSNVSPVAGRGVAGPGMVFR